MIRAAPIAASIVVPIVALGAVGVAAPGCRRDEVPATRAEPSGSGGPAPAPAPDAGSAAPDAGSAAADTGSAAADAGSASGAVAVAEAPIPPGTCRDLPFAATSPVPEASGAAWLELDGRPTLLVIADSGHDGAYALVDAESGATREQGKLPLGAPGDDLEGIAARGGRFYTISSPGWIRVYERRNAGFALVDGPYPLGPVDKQGRGMACEPRQVNCGRNYEGICLAPRPAGGCTGFALSKRDGALYCLIERDGRLAVDGARAIPAGRRETLADCAFAEDGRLYVGANLFDFGAVYRVTGWEDPARARLARIDGLLVGSPETLAVRGDVFYRMSDTGAAPSAMKRARCPGL